MDPVLRDFTDALQRSPIASSSGISALLSRAVARSIELEKSSDGASAIFFRQLGADLLRLRGNAHAKARLECLFRVCAFLWQYGDSQYALRIALHAIDLASATNNTQDLRRCYLALGAIYADTGDSGQALQSYMESLGIAEKMNDGLGESFIWNNLAALLVNAGLYGEALTCASQCLCVLDRSGENDLDLIRKAENNIVMARYGLGDHSGALASARHLVSKAPEPSTAIEAVSRILLEEHLILSLIAQEEISEAKDHVRYLQQLVLRFPSPRQKLIVSIVTGLCEVVAGNVPHGIEVLEGAVHESRIHQPSMYTGALSALSKAYEEVGDCERALEVTRRLISHLESVHLDASLANLSNVQSVLRAACHGVTSNSAELERTEAVLHSRVLQRELDRSRQEMLERMAVAADIREDISGEHGYRVGRLSALVAKELGWDRESCNSLDIAARLHDIGKIGIPEKILLDEKTLKEAERHFIASHTLVGAEILAKSDIPQVRIAEEIARCHHEWWDGSGYPRGLKGLAIPKSARIVALADVFDAMTHGRPYATAIPIGTALDEIASLRGRQFDPELTDHFFALVRRLATEQDDLDAYLGKAARNSPFLKARARIKEMLAQGRDSTALSAPPPPPGTPLN